MAPPSVVVIGVGEELRQDDTAGRLVARRLRGALPASVGVHESSGEPGALLELWAGAERAYLIDAMRSGRPVGSIVRLAEPDLPGFLPSTSSHGLGLGEAVALGRALGRAPRELVVFGIEAARTGPGPELSAPVARAVLELADRLRVELTPRGAGRA